MAITWHWLGAVRRTFVKSSCKFVAVLVHTNFVHADPSEEEAATATATAPAAAVTNQISGYKGESEPATYKKVLLTIEQLAAIKIQACFRGHLVSARRAFQALRSLVNLQALVRDVCMRRQARITIHCMQAMVRLQVRIRARQLLRSSEDMDLNVH